MRWALLGQDFLRRAGQIFSHIEKIYIAFDNDNAGIEGAKRLSDDVFGTRETYNILIPREGGSKDINDMLVKLKYERDDFLKLMGEAIRYGPAREASSKVR
jgi:DNA primase